MCALSLQCYVICVNNSTPITNLHFYHLQQPTCIGALLTIWHVFSLKFKRILIQTNVLILIFHYFDTNA